MTPVQGSAVIGRLYFIYLENNLRHIFLFHPYLYNFFSFYQCAFEACLYMFLLFILFWGWGGLQRSLAYEMGEFRVKHFLRSRLVSVVC
jgi:hypothetical protein